jgi:hypothetical protein
MSVHASFSGDAPRSSAGTRSAGAGARAARSSPARATCDSAMARRFRVGGGQARRLVPRLHVGPQPHSGGVLGDGETNRRRHRPGPEARLLAPPSNPAHLFPEEKLVGWLESGRLETGCFPATACVYARATCADARGVHRGAPILYMATIPSTAHDRDAAVRFVRFLDGPAARRIMGAHGSLPVRVPVVGDAGAASPPLRDLIRGTCEG